MAELGALKTAVNGVPWAWARRLWRSLAEQETDRSGAAPLPKGAVSAVDSDMLRGAERRLRPAVEALKLTSSERPSTTRIPAASGGVVMTGSRMDRVRRSRLLQLAGVVVLMAGAMIVAWPPSRSDAYQYYDEYPHLDHSKKTEIRWWMTQPPGPDLFYYQSRIFEATAQWNISTDVKLTQDARGASATPMHIHAWLYSDPDDPYGGWGGLYGPLDNSHHVTPSPGGFIRLNMATMDKYRGTDDMVVTVLAMHELGHAMGLAHVWDGCDSGAWHQGIMQQGSAWKACAWDSPQPDDINGINNLYSAGK